MYYINDLGFELKYTIKNYINEFPSSYLYDAFILTYTDLTINKIKNLNDDEKFEIVEFIYNKLNLTKFENYINNFIPIIEKNNHDIRMLMMQILSNKYKLTEMYDWELEKFFTIFYLEIIKDAKLKKIFFDYAPLYYEENKEALEYFTKMFGKLETQQDTQENEALIQQLKNL